MVASYLRFYLECMGSVTELFQHPSLCIQDPGPCMLHPGSRTHNVRITPSRYLYMSSIFLTGNKCETAICQYAFNGCNLQGWVVKLLMWSLKGRALQESQEGGSGGKGGSPPPRNAAGKCRGRTTAPPHEKREGQCGGEGGSPPTHNSNPLEYESYHLPGTSPFYY